MTWLFFGLLAPMFYAVSNFFDKFLTEKRIRNLIFLPIFSGGAAFCFGLILWATAGFHILPFYQVLVLLAAGFFIPVAGVPYYRAISLDDPSRVVPLFEIRPIFVWVLAYFFLGETLSGNQVYGFILILAGGLLLSIEELSLSTFRLRKALWFALAASLLYAVPAILYRSVVIHETYWQTISLELMGGGIGAAAMFLLIPRYRRLATEEGKQLTLGSWGILTLNELIYAVGLLCGFYATSLVTPTLAAILVTTQPVFALIFGLVLTIWWPHIVKEDIRKGTIMVKLVSIALMFWGVWVIK